MDFEKINADDTLNQGRIKINNIINNVGEVVRDQVSQLSESIDEISNDVNTLRLSIEPVEIIDGKYSDGVTVANSANFETHIFEIPNGIETVHVETRTYANTRLYLASIKELVNLSQKQFLTLTPYYNDPTDVSIDVKVEKFRYLVVPKYKGAGIVKCVGFRTSTYVEKNGMKQVKMQNTNFFKIIDKPNLFELKDGSFNHANCKVDIDENVLSIRKLTDLSLRPVVKIGYINLKAGTYTMYAQTDDDVSAYSNPFYISLLGGNYADERPNNYQYVWCSHTVLSKTFTIAEDSTFLVGISTNNVANANSLLNSIGSLTVRTLICEGSSAIPWINPINNYTLVGNNANVKNTIYPTIALFEKIGVIGDSFASGQLYLTGSPISYYNLSWGQIIARRNGISCTNFSKGGLTTKTWLSDNKGLPLLLSSEPHGLYIVALGINDIYAINNEGYSLGTENDFDLAHYQNTPDTFYGNLCKIIGNIKTKSPNAKIVLSTMATNSSDTRRGINNAIVRCSELANIAVIKQHENEFFLSEYYTNGMVGNHPTAPVYSGMATALEGMINDCMANNYDYFYNYFWLNS